METNTLLLTAAALFPAVALCVYVFKKDRVEKEPLGLLLLLLILGAASCYPAAEIETVLIDGIKAIFSTLGTAKNGTVYLSDNLYRAYNACYYFIGVALVEEGLKWIILLATTRKSKNFNSLFDGLIYAVFVSLGFAALENVMYVVRNGWMNAVMRAIMSVPGHMFFAVIMGYYYSLWHMYEKARSLEAGLKSQGLLLSQQPPFSAKRFLCLSLLMPVLAHGLYDYCCTLGTTLATVCLYLFVAFLYVYCFGKIRKMSAGDMDDNRYAAGLVLGKYPHLAVQRTDGPME